MANDIRRNFTKLSKDEKERYVKSVREMLHGSTDLYTQFAEWHDNFAGGAHGSSIFLAWHRAFIRLFELRLQDAHNTLYGNRNIALPYWDWTRQRSKRGRLWRKSFMGPNGDSQVGGSGPSTFLSEGPFPHPSLVTSGDPWFPGWEITSNSVTWQITRMIGESARLPRKGEIRRAVRTQVFDVFPFNNGVNVADTVTTNPIATSDDTITVTRTVGFAKGQKIIIGGATTRKIKEITSETVLTLTKTVGTTYSIGTTIQGQEGFQGKFLSFRNRFEGFIDGQGNGDTRCHNAVHVWVGGLMGNVPTAPIDPVFFLHHANVDRVWSRWQVKNREYDQQHIPDPAAAAASEPGLEDNMAPWAIKVKEVLNWQDLGNSLLHNSAGDSYEYDDDSVRPMSFN